ncbi:MAG: formylglycine-generating enzyme family protein [Planctomycetaceae bacterium]
MSSEQRELADPIANSVGIVLVPIPAGVFQMGSPTPKNNKPGRFQSELPRHRVTISNPFYIGACEVTQSQFEAVVGERPWEGKPLVKEGPDYAATYISWKKAVEFCRRLSKLEGKTYRLPTEAEWEYACRGRTKSNWSFGNDGEQLGEYGWFDANAYKAKQQYAHAIGQKQPNPWGLYDMHGNVWEWCSDWYGRYAKTKAATDPTGPKNGRVRVWRGGGFADPAVNTRSATRLSFGRVGYRPEFAAGFRVVREFK